MPPDSQAQKFLEMLGDPPPLDTISPEQNRAAMAAAISLTGPRTELADVQDLRIETVTGPVPVPVYRPDLAARPPATTYFHGRGRGAGNLESLDSV
jgi:acetyl esterase